MAALSSSLEDYLESIWLLSESQKTVRVKDVAQKMNISPASVVGAIKSLKDRNLVRHERYGYIELTPEGAQTAKEIYEKHQILFKFLHEMLDLPEETAEKDACTMEHLISDEGLDRMLSFIEFVNSCPEGEPIWLANFQEYIKTGVRPTQCPMVDGDSLVSLDKLKPKQSGIIIRLHGKGVVKKRLLDMGVIPGERVEVVKLAPLGDPIDIKIKSYHLSLRKEEAKAVLIAVDR